MRTIAFASFAFLGLSLFAPAGRADDAAPPAPAARAPRKVRPMPPAEVEQAVRTSLMATGMPRGATLTGVRAPSVVAPEHDKVTVDVPTLPRKAGPITVTAAVAFLSGAEIVARTTARLELALPPEAAVADVQKGAPITLVVQRGLVEVSVAAVAGADGDIGAVLPVLLKPSGRVIRARAVDRDHAVALEGS